MKGYFPPGYVALRLARRAVSGSLPVITHTYAFFYG